MNQAALCVLLVEDSPSDAQLFQHVFSRAATGNWTLVHVERLSEAIAACQVQSFDVTLLDLRLPDSEGLDTIAQFNQAVPDVPIIILTMFDDEELALSAMAQGAQDYLVKDQVTTQLLRRSIRYTIERSQILQQLRTSERVTLAALDKERELNQLKSYFVSMVSHEFRNPLSALRVMSEMLIRTDSDMTSEKREKYVKQINTTIEHMCQLLDEVILMGKVDTGNVEIQSRLINLRDYFEELIAAHQYSDNNQHPVGFNFQSHTDFVKLDPALLRYIVSNLISNAFKYSAAGCEVHIDVALLDNRIIASVDDRGIGIPAADQHRLFTTFNRCSNVGTIQGTGLGLAIVKRCIDLCNGDITIKSTVGIGTTVTFSLPIELSTNSD